MVRFDSDSPRLAIPQAVVKGLTVLIDDLEDLVPSQTRADLRTMRSRICAIYGVQDPQKPMRDTDVAQMLAEEDGDAITE